MESAPGMESTGSHGRQHPISIYRVIRQTSRKLSSNVQHECKTSTPGQISLKRIETLKMHLQSKCNGSHFPQKLVNPILTGHLPGFKGRVWDYCCCNELSCSSAKNHPAQEYPFKIRTTWKQSKCERKSNFGAGNAINNP